PQHVGFAIKRHPPDVAKAVGVDFRLSVLLTDKWIVLRDCIVVAFGFVVHIDAEYFAQVRVQLLTVAIGIVGSAAVAMRDVEIAVGPENERAAVVVPEWLLNRQQHFLGVRIGLIGIILGHAKARNDVGGLRFLGRVEDEELAVLFVIGMKCQPQKALFVLV